VTRAASGCLTGAVVSTFGVPGPDRITYSAQVAGSEPGREYKRRTVRMLDLRPGQAVLEVGCGPGTDLRELAEGVTATGSVIGLDVRPALVEEARARVADLPWVAVRVGDALALPLPEASVDRARADRMVQHVERPLGLFAELRRVLRPGGLAVLSEPDWDSLAIDPGDPETNRAFNRFVCAERVRNPIVGRQLARLAEQSGLDVLALRALPLVSRDFELTDKIAGLRRNSERAVKAGYLDRDAARRWLAELAAGPFLAASLLFAVLVRRPG
jgi:ubiquinone/menaquinone biosynthesis C-methylase UbiE